MHRRLTCSIILAGLLVAGLSHVNMSAAGGGTIQGTVKAIGLASNADAVVYIQLAPGTFTPPAKPADMDQRSMRNRRRDQRFRRLSYLSRRWEWLHLRVGIAILGDDGGSKAVSLPYHSFYELRLFRVVPQHNADFADSGVNAVVDIKEDILAPEAASNLVARN